MNFKDLKNTKNNDIETYDDINFYQKQLSRNQHCQKVKSNAQASSPKSAINI